jgi:hypothetical protein
LDLWARVTITISFIGERGPSFWKADYLIIYYTRHSYKYLHLYFELVQIQIPLFGWTFGRVLLLLLVLFEERGPSFWKADYLIIYYNRSYQTVINSETTVLF